MSEELSKSDRNGALLVLFWLVCWVFNTGALFANMQGSHLRHEYAVEDYRSDAAFTIGLGMLGPFALPCSIFATGFLEYGWRLPFISRERGAVAGK